MIWLESICRNKREPLWNDNNLLQDVTFKHVLGIHPKISFEKRNEKDICFPFNRDRWENNNTCQKRKHKMCYTNRSLILGDT